MPIVNKFLSDSLNMPVEVKKNTIEIRVRKPSDFDSKAPIRTITLDKERGIKARIQRLKGKNSTAIRTLIFPKSKFSVKQAVDWAKAHDFNVEEINMIEAKWSRKYINDLPDSAFLYIEPGGKKDSEGKTTPRSLRHFPYKDKDGKIDLPHLRNALARIPQSKLPEDVKKRVLMKARRIAKSVGINVSEEFLDPENLMFPITPPLLFHTLIEFCNMPDLEELYTEEELNLMEQKLQKAVTQFVEKTTIVTDYENGEETRKTDSSVDNWWVFDDGTVTHDSSMTDSKVKRTFSKQIDITDDDLQRILTMSVEEAIGEILKVSRNNKGISIEQIADEKNVDKKQIESWEDGNIDIENDVEKISYAYDIDKSILEMMIKLVGTNSNGHNDGLINITEEDGVIEIITESAFTTKELFEEVSFGNSVKEAVRFPCDIIIEEQNKGDNLRFRVPLFKIDEFTANGNRYTLECAENLVKDIEKLHRSRNALKEQDSRSVLDINVSDQLPDMMPTHGPRLGKDNPLLMKAGVILKAEIGDIEGDKVLFVIGETIETQAGKDMAALIRRGMVRGVSLVAYPVDYEENDEGGKDVYRLHLIGADFTDEGANLIQFKSVKNAGFEII